MKYNAGFIGAGNMGGALINAVKAGGAAVAAYDCRKEKCEAAGAVYETADTVVSSSGFVFFAVKPKDIEEAVRAASGKLSDGAVAVTIAAGVSLKSVTEWLGTDKVIRIMPNTPAAVGKGMILYCTGPGVTAAEEKAFLKLMKKAGVCDRIDESLIDAAAALSGCGPAFVYMFAEALADGAVCCGLPRDKALLYAEQTILGSAEMMLRSDKHPEALKDAVCSPGGTTIEGVLALEDGAFRSLAASAVVAAYEKTAALKK